MKIIMGGGNKIVTYCLDNSSFNGEIKIFCHKHSTLCKAFQFPISVIYQICRYLNKWVLSLVLKDANDSILRRLVGRSFQRVGAAFLNALFPQVTSLVAGILISLYQLNKYCVLCVFYPAYHLDIWVRVQPCHSSSLFHITPLPASTLDHVDLALSHCSIHPSPLTVIPTLVLLIIHLQP